MDVEDIGFTGRSQDPATGYTSRNTGLDLVGLLIASISLTSFFRHLQFSYGVRAIRMAHLIRERTINLHSAPALIFIGGIYLSNIRNIDGKYITIY